MPFLSLEDGDRVAAVLAADPLAVEHLAVPAAVPVPGAVAVDGEGPRDGSGGNVQRAESVSKVVNVGHTGDEKLVAIEKK